MGRHAPFPPATCKLETFGAVVMFVAALARAAGSIAVLLDETATHARPCGYIHMEYNKMNCCDTLHIK